MNKFNLIEEPWIPCLMLKTNKIELLSLFDTLTQAHDIKEIADNSPLVVVSLHRLLLAILHRKFGPTSFDNWKELWQRGQSEGWNADILRAYFESDKQVRQRSGV
jgi:CRISPR system Cascade subunit CasA